MLTVVTYLFEATGGIEGRFTYETSTAGEPVECSLEDGNCALYHGAIRSFTATDNAGFNIETNPPSNNLIQVADNGQDLPWEPIRDVINFRGEGPFGSFLVALGTRNTSLLTNAALPADINFASFEDFRFFYGVPPRPQQARRRTHYPLRARV